MKASTIIAKAQSYIGTKESPANSNNVVFNTHYYGKAVSGSAYPWCMVFVWDIFRLCGASNLFYNGQKTAYCPTLMSWAKSKGKFVKGSYKAGDVLFFNFSGGSTAAHTGFCVSQSGSNVTTIEGNTSASSSGSQSNGGMVAKRTRSTSVILGAYRPSYEAESSGGGSTTKKGWNSDSKGWWYVKSDGSYYKSCWAKIDGKDYYFWADGYMAADEYIKSSNYSKDGKLYYVDAKGAWNGKSYKWNQNKNGWWIEGVESKWYPKSEWCKIDKKYYYFWSNGYMVTGTKTINNKKYTFNKDGSLKSPSKP
jgi:hypothetical protein